MNQSFYDNRPLKYEAVGNGSYIYRWDIQEVTTTDEDGNSRTHFSCYEVTVWATVTANKITDAAITARWGNNYEQKLINEYNAAKEGLYEGAQAEAKITAYLDFLTERSALKAIVDADCVELGIN